MSTNPFSPPLSAVADMAPATLPPAKKPVSVWITQLVGAILACAAAYGLVKGLSPGGHASMFQIAFVVVIQGALTAFLLAVVIGAQRRTRYGRWMGLALVGLILVYVVVRSLLQLRLLTVMTGNEVSYQTGAFFGSLVVALLVGAWFRAFGFSPRSKAWFGLLRQGETVRASDRWKP